MNNLNQRINVLEQKLLQKMIEMEQCDHLFVKQQEGYWIGGFHSSDYEYTPCTIKCLKCGLTNYHINMDLILREKYSYAIKLINPSKYYWFMVNDEVFKKQFGSISGQGRDLKDIFNLISEEVLTATDPISLFQIAKQINPNADNEELFEIMKELFKIEKTEGKINLKDELQLNSLRDRFSNAKGETKKLSHSLK